ERIGERLGVVARWLGHISDLPRRTPERRLTLRIARVASSSGPRRLPDAASVRSAARRSAAPHSAEPARPGRRARHARCARPSPRPATARCGTVGTERRQDQRRTGMRTLNGIDEIESLIGTELGSSEWVTMDQHAINTFADVTDEHQWIHVDEARAAEGPY